jgi:hypothetical protein
MATLSTMLLILMALKGDCNCRRNYPWNFMDLSIAVLLPVAILEGTLLGSFHWRSNEEIPTLTLTAGMCLHGHAIICLQFKLQSTYYSYANLFVVFLHEFWTNHGRAGRIWDLWVCTFEPSSWYLDISSVGEMVLSKF